MMYQTKRTCSRARGRSAWGCSRRDAMYTMSLHFMIKLFAPVVTYRKKTPQSIKSPREKNKREKIYICVLEDQALFGLFHDWRFKSRYDCLNHKFSFSYSIFHAHSPHQTHSSTPFASTPNTLHTFSPPTLSPTSPLALALSTPPPCPPSDSPSSSPPASDHPSNRPASPLSGKAPQGSGVRFRETIFHGHSRMKRGTRWRSR